MAGHGADLTGGGFWADLRAAGAVCFSNPGLLVTAAFIAAAPVVFQAAAVTTGRQTLLWVGVLLAIVLGGFGGAKRVWLRRLFEGETFGAPEGFDLTFGYFGRFFRLSLLLGLVSMPIFIWIGYVNAQAVRDGVPVPTWPRWFLLGAILVVDVAFTFVIPELTFNSRSAFGAIGVGIKLLVKSLPHSWPYLLTPGLLVLASGSVLAGSIGNLWAIAAWTAAGAIVSLVFAGAILRFYLRLRPTATEALGSEPTPGDTPVSFGNVAASVAPAPSQRVASVPAPITRDQSATRGPAPDQQAWDIDSFRAAGWSDQQLRALGWFEPAPERESSNIAPEHETPPN